MDGRPWISIEHAGLDIFIKGGEIPPGIQDWIDFSSDDFAVESSDSDSWTLSFPPEYEIEYVRGIAIFLKCRMTQSGYQTAPHHIKIEEVCSHAELAA